MKSKQYHFVYLFFVIQIIFILSGNAQNIYINEFLASNVTINPDIVDFDDYSDWIELYNAEGHEVELGGYYLTDDFNNLTKWIIPSGTTIPARGFIRLWADGEDDEPGNMYTRPFEPFENFTTTWYHLNFKLSKGGEELGLVNPQFVKIDSVIFGLQLTDVSYGRQPDGGANWYYFGEPTPGNPNTTPATLNTEMAEEPIFSIPGGFHNMFANLTLTADAPDATIRYTKDGSRPTSTSLLYSTPLIIRETTVIRARVFSTNKLPGKIITNTYFLNENHSIPVLSISAFPETLWDEEIGIYANAMKGREIPISFEYFLANNEPGVRLDAGLRLSGQASFNYPQKPFTIYARDRFGPETIKQKIYSTQNLDQFKTLYLRNSGSPDNRHTMFRDALQQSLVINQMDIDCQAYQPAATYINGQYWGIYNIREKINTDYLASHHNVDPNNIDLLEYDFSQIPVVTEGDPNHYNTLLNFIKNNDLTIQDNYNFVKNQIDINEYLNYVITEMYCDNINWMNTNVRWWRERKPGSKYRFIIVDMDWGFGTDFPNFSSHYSHDMLSMAVSAPGTLLDTWRWSTVIFRKLIENNEFKNEFIQRFASHLNTTFNAQRVEHILNTLKSKIDNEMFRHIERWNDNPEILVLGEPPILSYGHWEAEVEIMREFAKKRTAYQRDHIINFFGLGEPATLSVDVSNSSAGNVFINSVPVPDTFSGIYFTNIPIRIEAIPKPGYRFERWEGVSSSTSDSISIILNNPIDHNLVAVFTDANENVLANIIDIDFTLYKENSPYIALGDLQVIANKTLTIQPGVELRMPQDANIIIYGNVEMQGDEANPITITANSKSGATNWGALCIINGTGQSVISHVNLLNASRGPDINRDIGAISGYNSDLLLDHVQITDAPFPVFIQFGNAIVKNSTFHSEKICDLINIKYASSALVENCDLRGNTSFDTDAIDYDQIDSGIIRNNRIYNFFGINSDGIDLGEASKNILIENNLIYHCFDKGVSVGQASTAILKNNIIVGCDQGVGVKDFDSHAQIINTTFYGNTYSIASFEKNIGAGGGSADVINCILTNPGRASYLLDNLSSISFSYSLSDTEILPGTGNILADPLFLNNFRLSAESPAIDAGDPTTDPDPDGSRTDIGCYPFTGDEINLIINEIHYNPVEGESFEFIELYNASTADINLSGYNFSEGLSYTFPEGTQILRDEYIIIANNGNPYHSNGYTVFDWQNQALSNEWATLLLKNDQGNLIDFVTYGDKNGWPASANGTGPSLELRNPHTENMFIANWRRSSLDGGTPGKPNKAELFSDIYINEFSAINNSIIKDENNEFDDWIEIYNGNQNEIDISGLYLTDDFNNPLKYQIPIRDSEITTIQPHRYLILWADGNTNQGNLHLDFQLNGNGEQIGLVQVLENDTVFIDQIEFGVQTADISYGRKNDGGTNWQQFKIPTPGAPNTMPDLFQKGILLVNGVSFLYGEEIINAYRNHAFSGDLPISFWDCFEEPGEGYISELPKPLGHGQIPFDTLARYSTVIWIGNNYTGDLDFWELANIELYLKYGGNVVLLTRRGQDFISDDLRNKIGLRWEEDTYVTLQNCIASAEDLNNISVTGVQSLNSVFNTELETSESKLLFKETISFRAPRGLGLWYKPVDGGAYRSNGGQFIFLSGRPYRYDNIQLRNNMEYILENYLSEPYASASDQGDDLSSIRHYRLDQNYPNPFNPSTTINFTIPVSGFVYLKVYNILGEEVSTLVSKKLSAGSYSYTWDAGHLASGLYIYKLKAIDYISVKKALLLK